MVQKLVFWPIAPNPNETAKASQSTVFEVAAVSISDAVKGGVADACRSKALGTQAA